jgi:hypothetical protein
MFKQFILFLRFYSPSPLTGEGRDEGGFNGLRHPSPSPLPQGERVYFVRRAKYIIPLILLLGFTLGAPALLKAEDAATPGANPAQAPTAAESAAQTVPNVFADHLNPIDHAPFWTKFELSYDYSEQGDLLNSAAAINNQSYVNPGGLGSYTGGATAGNGGLGLGFEIGMLLNPSMGIALGAHYLQNNEYLTSLNYNDTNQDAESVTLLPTVVPITLDYYFFLPDGGGRFFLSAGIGYYAANVRVGQNTTTNNFLGSNNTPARESGDIWSGNLSSAVVGFQVGIGREFAVNKKFGFTVFAKGRYAKISNFQGTLLDSTAVAGNFGLAAGANGVVDVDSTSNITAANNEHYATIDFTGVEAGIALNFYGF